MHKIDPSEITPEHVYLSRRKFLKGMGALAAGAVLLSACDGEAPPSTPASVMAPPTDELTPYESINAYNNYYEFSLGKEAVARLSQGFKTDPWTVEVEGLVAKPKTFDLDALGQFAATERIYRMRCVEAWSMVIPWFGFPLAALLKEVEPTSEAQYVRFETVYAPEQMPGQESTRFSWPYIEGLRLDEAMHDLTILATGIYGKPLLPQTGAPIRLVVPWKYGFKGIKSIVKIDLVADMPTSFWMAQAPNEYGFFANVNPNVPHPRWSQSSERRIGENSRRRTLLFNGYEAEVAQLYEGMDLTKWF
ncbi:MAG: protein-methionine-sulfoxide reductase catalytic subunit MsrP [Chloroflexi bacterium]|nr:protein-methionine-sulfoxide reductase catalytic subunit MsrP [Chloroflexota bacterium]MBU1746934.1 protein-methionine-sulfoxide reductase catalytic subunit MsrP [Chloroflexota bacterium]